MRVPSRNLVPQRVQGEFLPRGQNDVSALQRGLNGYMQDLSRSQDLPRGSDATSSGQLSRRARSIKMGAATREKHKEKFLKCPAIHSSFRHGDVANEKEIVYQHPEHCAQGFPIFEDIRRQGKLCDVTLKVT